MVVRPERRLSVITVKGMAQEIVDAYTLIDNVERGVREARLMVFSIEQRPLTDQVKGLVNTLCDGLQRCEKEIESFKRERRLKE